MKEDRAMMEEKLAARNNMVVIEVRAMIMQRLFWKLVGRVKCVIHTHAHISKIQTTLSSMFQSFRTKCICYGHFLLVGGGGSFSKLRLDLICHLFMLCMFHAIHHIDIPWQMFLHTTLCLVNYNSQNRLYQMKKENSNTQCKN